MLVKSNFSFTFLIQYIDEKVFNYYYNLSVLFFHFQKKKI